MDNVRIIIVYALLIFSLSQNAKAESDQSNCYIFRDVNRTLTTDEVIKLDLSLFQKITCNKNSFGFSDDTFWVRLYSENISGKILSIPYPSLDTIKVFFVSKNQYTVNESSGDSINFSERSINHRSPKFTIPTQPAIDYALLRVTTKGSVQIPIVIQKPSETIGETASEYLSLGLFYGVIISLVLYNLTLFFFTHDRQYFYYVGYATCFLVFQLSLNAIGFQYLWKNEPWLTNFLTPISIFVMYIFILLFANRFINIDDSHKLFVVCKNLFLLISSFGVLISTFFDYQILLQFIGIYSIIVSIFLLLTAIYLSIKGNIFARFFLIAWTFFLVGIILLTLKNFAIVPSTFITNYSMQIGSAIEMILLSFGLGYRIRVLDKKSSQTEGELRKIEGIVNTTQSLAHDVRKPFSMFKSIIQSVESVSDPAEASEIMKASLPEVNQAMASVEGMIQDVMQIGSDSKPHLEETSPETLIEASLGELFRVYPDADVSISYAFSHKHNISVDTLRVGRVFSNILGNALQAMNQNGHLWIHTKESNGFFEFILGNAGSVIPKESLPKLFDAFFTSGKKGGTGLGLAIAKKIVEAHGGNIRCESEITPEHPRGKVEFFFTLPCADTLVQERKESLPRSSKEIQSAIEAAKSSLRTGAGADPRESELETEILGKTKGKNQTFPILIVEDEAVYRNGLIALLQKNTAICCLFEVHTAMKDTEAFSLALEKKPCLIIQDVDLGPASKNGIEIVRELRSKGFSGNICIHSNRFLMEDTKTALDAGADTVLPKPLGRSHFLKLLSACLPNEEKKLDVPIISHDEPVAPRKPTFAYVDDSPTFLIGMRMKVKSDATLHEFKSSAHFFEKVEKYPSFLSSLDFIVTDFHFDPSDKYNGLTFAEELRKRGFQKPILLASGADIEPEELTKAGINEALPKVINGWEDLKKWASMT